MNSRSRITEPTKTRRFGNVSIATVISNRSSRVMDTPFEPQGTLRDILYIIFKHKVKMLILFFTVVLTVTIGSFLMSPTYEASSKILLKFGRENVYTPTTPAGSGSSRCFWTLRGKSALIPK